MLVRGVITVLCGVGLYASVFMLRKTRRAERGELSEPSVVQTPRARLFGDTPNALLGTIYYPAFTIAAWTVHEPWQAAVLVACGLFAAGTSAVLAYSLTFVTRMSCPYCWCAHWVNWLLAVWSFVLFFKLSYWR